jgi:hypothetical protein
MFHIQVLLPARRVEEGEDDQTLQVQAPPKISTFPDGIVALKNIQASSDLQHDVIAPMVLGTCLKKTDERRTWEPGWGKEMALMLWRCLPSEELAITRREKKDDSHRTTQAIQFLRWMRQMPSQYTTFGRLTSKRG